MSNLAALMAEAVRQHQAGRLAEAASLYRRVLALDARQPQAHSNLGAVLRAEGKPDEAEASYRRAIALKPDYADAHTNLGNLLKRSRPAEALASYERAITFKPGDAGLYFNYATTLQEQGRTADAIAAYAKAIALQPRFAEAWSNLGVAHADRNEFEEAVRAYRKAIEIKPDFVQAINNLGLALQEQGRLDEAIAAFDRALALDPGHAESRTNRIFAELYRPGVSLTDMLSLSRQWSIAPVPAASSPRAHDREKPRLGFVSADFRQHAVGFLVIPALEGLKRLGFEIVCYSNSLTDDALTERFRTAAMLWRVTTALSDDQLEAQIRADGIDILFDLSGHSRANRLNVFACKPAPVQIAWVGYPATSGIDAIDYLLTDNRQTPEGADVFYSEKLLRLPHSYIGFEPREGAPEVGALPARRNGFVTFASFNALKKVNPAVMTAWGRILARLPDAKLLLKSPALDCPATRAHTAARFVAAGMPETRLEFLGSSSPQAHIAAMARADIALDTFPYSGGMTTLETLWMGSPVITWPGETFASRHSLGYLNTVGLTELVADSAEDYGARAVELAQDIDRLATLRVGLRARILSSPLGDKDGFAADLAAILTTVWQRARAGLPAAAISASPERHKS